MVANGSSGTGMDQQELLKHRAAYLTLFRAVLNKRPLSGDQKAAVLSNLKEYLKSSISNPDEFIDHLDEFAKMLGVPAGALGNFIGQNFLKALEQAEKELPPQKSPSAGGAKTVTGKSAPSRSAYDSILEELNHTMEVESPGRMVDAGFGIIKILHPDGDLFGQSAFLPELAPLLGVGPNTAKAAPPTSDAPDQEIPGGSEKKDSSAPVSAKASGASRGGSLPLVDDQPILNEILEKFDSVLRVDRKLVVPPFPEGGGGEGSSEGESESQPAGGATEEKGSDGSNPPGGSSSAGVSPPPAKSYVPEDRTPILDEILQKFDSVLRVDRKLEVSDGLSSAGDGAGPSGEEAPGEPWEPSEEDQEQDDPFEPLELTFTDYFDGIKTVQTFQQKGDRQGYAKWLSSRGGNFPVAMKLKNMESREKKGEGVDKERELEVLAGEAGVDVASLKDLAQRLKVYDRLRGLLFHLIQSSKKEGGAVLGTIQKIWPQLKTLFNDPSSFQSMNSRFKIILLQVSDQDIRKKIQGIIHPYLEKAADIAGEFQAGDRFE